MLIKGIFILYINAEPDISIIQLWTSLDSNCFVARESDSIQFNSLQLEIFLELKVTNRGWREFMKKK